MRASARTAGKTASPKRSAPAAAPRGRAPRRAGGKKAKQGRKTFRRDLGRQVAEELRKLRPILKEVGAAFLDRLDGELAGLTLALDGQDVTGEPPALPSTAILSRMAADIKALKVKPRKGRVKDLRRIETLLDSLSARIPPQP